MNRVELLVGDLLLPFPSDRASSATGVDALVSGHDSQVSVKGLMKHAASKFAELLHDTACEMEPGETRAASEALGHGSLGGLQIVQVRPRLSDVSFAFMYLVGAVEAGETSGRIYARKPFKLSAPEVALFESHGRLWRKYRVGDRAPSSALHKSFRMVVDVLQQLHQRHEDQIKYLGLHQSTAEIRQQHLDEQRRLEKLANALSRSYLRFASQLEQAELMRLRQRLGALLHWSELQEQAFDWLTSTDEWARSLGSLSDVEIKKLERWLQDMTKHSGVREHQSDWAAAWAKLVKQLVRHQGGRSRLESLRNIIRAPGCDFGSGEVSAGD